MINKIDMIPFSNYTTQKGKKIRKKMNEYKILNGDFSALGEEQWWIGCKVQLCRLKIKSELKYSQSYAS